MMKTCEKCHKLSAWLFLILGILFLLQDLGTWAFWNISWYTGLFVLLGLVGVASSGCKMCQKARK